MGAGEKRVLFVCIGNSCRSQMAEGFLNALGGRHFEARSAGIHPSIVHPKAVRVMKEVGIDISSHESKHVDAFRGRDFDFVITVCDEAREACPVFAGKVGKRLHWNFPDPALALGNEEEVLSEFRRVREMIREKVIEFIEREAGVQKPL